MSYKIILVDPPWQYRDKSLNRGGAERHYPTMTLEEMAELNVGALADKESALCMWVTMPQLENAFRLIRAWGFVPVTCLFVWVKTYSNGDPANPFVGMGHHTRSNAELMLLAKPKSGKTPKRVNAAIRQVQYFPVTRHSAKPDEFRDLLVDLYGDLPRVELFAREAAPGWDRWGNEVDSTIEINAKAFDSLEAAVVSMISKKPVSFSDYRAICPDCYSHLEIGASESGDGGGLLVECGCGFKESGLCLNGMKSSIKKTLMRLENE